MVTCEQLRIKKVGLKASIQKLGCYGSLFLNLEDPFQLLVIDNPFVANIKLYLIQTSTKDHTSFQSTQIRIHRIVFKTRKHVNCNGDGNLQAVLHVRPFWMQNYRVDALELAEEDRNPPIAIMPWSRRIIRHIIRVWTARAARGRRIHQTIH